MEEKEKLKRGQIDLHTMNPREAELSSFSRGCGCMCVGERGLKGQRQVVGNTKDAVSVQGWGVVSK